MFTGCLQFADGGIFATKPYISSSRYILAMSNYRKDDWCDIWDGLCWRFISTHREVFLKNARSTMIVHMLDRINKEGLAYLNARANDYLLLLDKQN